MERRPGPFWQTALVWLLFLASVTTLLINSVMAFLLPGQEQSIRGQLREATEKLVSAAISESDRIAKARQGFPKDANRRLESLTLGVLRDYPGVEGGFYVNHKHDEFAGYAFPTEPTRGPLRDTRREPPPREEPYIRIQARQSAGENEGEVLIQARDVGPSRVVVATAPVGRTRPASLVVWLMYRLTGPEQHRAQVNRYRVSTYLALGGIISAMVLTWRLARTLRGEREARERLREELRRSEHLAALGKLLAGVAHEVRNPLAAIRSTVQLWQRLPETARTPGSLDAVIQAVDRLNHTVTQLLHFSRADHIDRQPVQLKAIIEETLELIAAQAACQRVALEHDLACNPPFVLGSANALRQVFLNLAQNALQAMPEGGRLLVRTEYDGRLRQATVRVSDTGPGISPEDEPRLFEPFFSRREDGTGLGLALCREIVIQHGGSIDYLSDDGRGAMFRVVLPTEGAIEK